MSCTYYILSEEKIWITFLFKFNYSFIVIGSLLMLFQFFNRTPKTLWTQLFEIIFHWKQADKTLWQNFFSKQLKYFRWFWLFSLLNIIHFIFNLNFYANHSKLNINILILKNQFLMCELFNSTRMINTMHRWCRKFKIKCNWMNNLKLWEVLIKSFLWGHWFVIKSLFSLLSLINVDTLPPKCACMWIFFVVKWLLMYFVLSNLTSTIIHVIVNMFNYDDF